LSRGNYFGGTKKSGRKLRCEKKGRLWAKREKTKNKARLEKGGAKKIR